MVKLALIKKKRMWCSKMDTAFKEKFNEGLHLERLLHLQKHELGWKGIGIDWRHLRRGYDKEWKNEVDRQDVE